MTGLIPVEEAQARLLALKAPLGFENISLSESFGRYISHQLTSGRDQPAAPLSAMDGYAIRFADMPGPWELIGESAAGTAPSQSVHSGQAMRIFTGAMMPDGADSVLIQEDAQKNSSHIVLNGTGPSTPGTHVRPRAHDFANGDLLLPAGTRMTAGSLALAAMSGAGRLAVGRRPRIAIITTGDELVAPGLAPEAGQTPDCNGVMLAALLAAEPPIVSAPLPVRDDRQILSSHLKAMARHHDVIVTVGGASVGDHDHVRDAIADAGGKIDFWRIAMRPGKPLLAATLEDCVVLGLPGNPSSAFVTAILFLLPLVRHLAGAADPLPECQHAPLAEPLAGGGQRRDYLRARLNEGMLYPFAGQDSGLTRPLALANALIVRDIGASVRKVGDITHYIAL